MSTQAAKGAAFLEEKKYDEAIEQYTEALKISPSAPDYYIKRAMAYQRKTPPDYAASLKDAEIGLVSADRRARRELITQAQLRRGVALMNLERYADAKFVFGIVKELDPKEKTLFAFEYKVDSKLKGLPADDERVVCKVKKIPDVEIPSAEVSKPAAVAKPSTATEKLPTAPVQTPAAKIKHDWYQSADKVYFTLLAKGVPEDKTSIDIHAESLTISFPTITGGDYDFSLEPLYAPIDPEASISKISATKIEITLKKVTASKWPTLEGVAKPVAPSNPTGMDAVIREKVLGSEAPSTAAAPVPEKSSAPAYPTSSRTGPKNWDKLADEIGDDATGGDDVNNFFQSLYKGADPDTQRAMMKSYQESNGTVLSTNWSEVGKGQVETAPPDGMVAKKWGE
ncbi:SGS-domain-containing protein [Microthyrium microscopicum]|uniref:SGS-domain-containing protein n=1 Tax=Microthyrium microscopicum TaxID=703497 RepID=A0A6A6UQ28_9PEZI|nr:SGS-domain-containing protein [Microthyrium microscopicum]